MDSFSTEHFLLLTDAEMEGLVSARNRAVYQPKIDGFLYAARRLRPLRRLSFPASGLDWVPPSLTIRDDGGVVDETGAERGRRWEFPLPNRPGEPQMRIGFDWFWSRFCGFLAESGFWALESNGILTIYHREDHPFDFEQSWQSFWGILAGKAHLEQSVGLFLDNKTLFKNQAKPWDDGDIPILSEDMARFLHQYYQFGASRRRHFKQGSIPGALSRLENVIQEENYPDIPPPAHIDPSTAEIGGDFSIGTKQLRCGGCGEVIPRKSGFDRLAVFLKDADERPQSGRHKDDRNRYCPRCVATVFLCPVKLAPETLTVRFRSPGDEWTPEAVLESLLRKHVAQTLHVLAGGFISLHASETLGKGMLVKTLGARHYTLWKTGTLFAPDLFSQGFHVEVHPGEESFSLPSWSLWMVSALAKLEPILSPAKYPRGPAERDFWRVTGRALRYLLSGKVFHGFYALLSGEHPIIKTRFWSGWKFEALQDFWRELEQLWSKETHMPLPDYPKIVGFAGLLLPFAERVNNALKNPNDRKRAVGKLLEEADRPIQYAYTAARESGAPTFIFCKRPGNHFFYDKALELLEWAGEELEPLKAEAKRVAEEVSAFEWTKKFEEKVFLGPDQISRVTAALVNEGETPPYRNEADWRAFAYQVKLALWSMFPQHLGGQNKEKE